MAKRDMKSAPDTDDDGGQTLEPPIMLGRTKNYSKATTAVVMVAASKQHQQQQQQKQQ